MLESKTITFGPRPGAAAAAPPLRASASTKAAATEPHRVLAMRNSSPRRSAPTARCPGRDPSYAWAGADAAGLDGLGEPAAWPVCPRCLEREPNQRTRQLLRST